MGLDVSCAKVFLKEQTRLFPKPVVDTVEEALDFLEDVGALVFPSKEALTRFMREECIDFEGDVAEELEVFKLPNGRYMYVEA